MRDFLDIILILLGLVLYFIILYFRWNKKMRAYFQKVKKEEAQLIHLEKMASLGVLSAGIAHEINNPLTFLVNNLHIIKRDLEGEDASRGKAREMRVLVEECLEGINRIKRVVEDLLSFSRRSKGQRELVDINKLLDTSLRILWNEIKYKVDIVKDYKSKSLLRVDSNQLSQVFLNIIINGAQAIKEKGTIYLSTQEDGENVIIEISDTGKGLSEEEISKIFEPFYTTKGGTGLGLSVSRDIIHSHGGKIKVRSNLGKGTTFTIVLPKKSQESSAREMR